MKMCGRHWAQLRRNVSEYHLDHLIAPSGEAAVEMMARQVQGKAGELDFDPLLSANTMLMSMALDFGGLAVMAGDICPACWLRGYDWTEGAAYQSRIYARKHGLLLPDDPGVEGEGPL